MCGLPGGTCSFRTKGNDGGTASAGITAVPEHKPNAEPETCPTPRPSFHPGPMFDTSYFNLGTGRYSRKGSPQSKNHPNNVCRTVTHFFRHRMWTDIPAMNDRPRLVHNHNQSNKKKLMVNHFESHEIKKNLYPTGCIDCLVCGRLSIKYSTRQSLIILKKRRYAASQPNNSMRDGWLTSK